MGDEWDWRSMTGFISLNLNASMLVIRGRIITDVSLTAICREHFSTFLYYSINSDLRPQLMHKSNNVDF